MSRDKAGGDALLGDVVAFTALPAVWVGQPPEEIARAIAQTLDRTLPLESVAVLMRSEQGIVEARAGNEDALDEDVAAWRATMPVRKGTLQMDIGALGARGAILARTGATPPERLLLVRLAANLADTALREAALHQQAAISREQVMRHEKLSALGQLVSGVAHELRTPLTYANNNIYLAQLKLSRAKGLGPEERAAIEGCLAEVVGAHERIERTVSTLRQLSSPRPRVRVDLDLSDAVAEATRLFALTNVGSVVLLRTLRSESRILGDTVEIQQIVLNLLQNAAEAAPRSAQIHVQTQDQDGRACLIVDDNGPGVPEEARGRLFDPFYTTKPGGTGLGLSIVRRIVEAHGASIGVEDAPGGGARFRIAFPIVADHAQRATAGELTSS